MSLVSCRGLRLLLVGPYPPPFGGIASHLVTLVPGLKARGAEDIAIVSFAERDDVSTIEGATVYRFKPKNHAWRLAWPRNWNALVGAITTLTGVDLGFRRVIAEATKAMLINEVASRHVSRVVSFYQTDMSFAMLPCARLWHTRRRLVLTVLGEPYEDPQFFKRIAPLIQRMAMLPSAVVSSSKHCARSLESLGVTRVIEAVYYGIDLDRFPAEHLRDSFRAEIGVGPDDVLLVFMGRFTVEMGLDSILGVAPSVFEAMPQVKLLLAGANGPMSKSAASFAAGYPDRVRILNDIPFTLQPSIYAACDIVLAPSRDQHACMGMAIKEAMAAWRPVIGAIAGGVPEAIVHGETGLLVPLDATKNIDAKEFQTAIRMLAVDSSLRARMGRAARLRAEKQFGMDRTIDRMGELFISANRE